MMLGVVIHSALAYFPPETEAWAFQDPYVGSEWSYLIVEFIHLFRMPAFFLISGSSEHCSRSREGGQDAAQPNRPDRSSTLRLSWFPSPTSPRSPANTANVFSSGDPEPFFVACGVPIDWLPTSTMHLWFLYYLALITALQSIGVSLLSVLKVKEGRTHAFTQDLVARPWFFLVFTGLASTLIAWLFEWGEGLPTSDAWAPSGPILLYYWFWYQLGWAIYQAKASFRSFEKPPGVFSDRGHCFGCWACTGSRVWRSSRPPSDSSCAMQTPPRPAGATSPTPPTGSTCFTCLSRSSCPR